MAARCRRVRRAALEKDCAHSVAALFDALALPAAFTGRRRDGRAFKTVETDLGRNSGADTLRFVIILILAVLAVLAGLFVYGQMLEPETRTISQEAEDAN